MKIKFVVQTGSHLICWRLIFAFNQNGYIC